MKSHQTSDIVFIQTHGRTVIKRIHSIQILSADGAYTTIIFDDQDRILCTKPLGFYAKLLPQPLFYRCHNSYIINISQFKGYNTHTKNAMVGSIPVPVSRRKYKGLITAVSMYLKEYR